MFCTPPNLVQVREDFIFYFKFQNLNLPSTIFLTIWLKNKKDITFTTFFNNLAKTRLNAIKNPKSIIIEKIPPKNAGWKLQIFFLRYLFQFICIYNIMYILKVQSIFNKYIRIRKTVKVGKKKNEKF